VKVLLSAYACEPGKGSEPEVGLRTLLAAAQRHDVWVITRENNLPSLRTHLANEPLRDRIHLVGLEVPGRLLRLKKRHGAFAQLYYDQWQRALADRAIALDRDVRFDVVHHVTFAAYWKRAGVALLDRPLVWGPVGGGVRAPIALYRELGAVGILEELARNAVRPLVARLPGIRRAQRRAAVVLTQNAETAARISATQAPVILPNAVSVRVPDEAVPAVRDNTVVSVARMTPWKGVRLAVEAFAAMRTPEARMVVIGRGAQFDRIRLASIALGVSDRVTFTGRLPRDEVLATVAGARALVHAALHEEAGLAVSEALSYGTPVVCIDRGGPPELLKHWPDVPSCAVEARNGGQTVRALAAALDDVFAAPPPKTAVHDPVRSYERSILDAYEIAARRG
jgi:glycosyltransferase involved in cell wall biosynthesis